MPSSRRLASAAPVSHRSSQEIVGSGHGRTSVDKQASLAVALTEQRIRRQDYPLRLARALMLEDRAACRSKF
jgi:hypothetical protein